MTAVAVIAVAAASFAPIAEAQAPSCGGPGAPACPLQGWMRKNVASPLSSSNMTAVAAALDRSARLAPDPSWSSWSVMATRGAAAARSGDIAGVRASCKACHDAYREQYKARFRTRPVPP